MSLPPYTDYSAKLQKGASSWKGETSTSQGEQAPLLNQPPPVFQTQFAAMSMHMSDRLRFLQFPMEVTQAVQNVVAGSWHQGIQEHREYYGSYEIKMRGNPWRGYGDESVYARRLMYRIFEALFNLGWVLSISTDVSKKQLDKDTLIFRQQNPTPQLCTWMSVAFSKQDRIRFIDAPVELIQHFIPILAPVTQAHGNYKLPGVYEFKIRGCPWFASGGATMETRKLLLVLMAGLEAHGFTVYASVSINLIR